MPWSSLNSSARKSITTLDQNLRRQGKYHHLLILPQIRHHLSQEWTRRNVPPPRSNTAIVPVSFSVQSISESRRCRLIDDPQHFKTGDFTSIFCGLSLRIIEISRYCNHSLINSFHPRKASASSFKFPQNKARHLRR